MFSRAKVLSSLLALTAVLVDKGGECKGFVRAVYGELNGSKLPWTNYNLKIFTRRTATNSTVALIIASAT